MHIGMPTIGWAKTRYAGRNASDGRFDHAPVKKDTTIPLRNTDQPVTEKTMAKCSCLVWWPRIERGTWWNRCELAGRRRRQGRLNVGELQR
jgi:hypothetical protein